MRFDKAQGVPGIGAVPAYQTHLDFLRTRARIEAGRLGEGRCPACASPPGSRASARSSAIPARSFGLGAHDTDDHTGDGSLALDLDWPELPGSTAFTAVGCVAPASGRG